ncbi:MAG: ureD [Caulobacteraceae bacterium]|nr:ureD [Caulobacteraceae bacterium]
MPDRRGLGALRLVDDSFAPAPALGAGRPHGELRLGFAVHDGVTRLAETYQAGCLRVRQPKEATDRPYAVLINTGGGIVGGDQLLQSVSWQAGARAGLVSQAAEKVYRSSGALARIETRLRVGPGADAEWLPQETIVFDQARLERRLEVDLDVTSRFLGVEAMILGRSAMGESVRQAWLSDRWRVRRGGRLVYADALNLTGSIDQMMDRPAIGAGARAMALVLQVGEGVAARLEMLRQVMEGAACRVAASAWNGLLAVRLLAVNGQRLKAGLEIVLSILRDGAPLPRVWTC